jgi:hypothetical protein
MNLRRSLRRRSAPGVRNGVVQRKNNWTRTPNYHITPQAHLVVDRQPPGRGYRHLLLQRDVRRFVELLPDWQELSQGLNAIVLAPGSRHYLGYHLPGLVAVAAWERQVERVWDVDFVDEHRLILALLGVPMLPVGTGNVLCRFTENTARAFLLLHVLLHELGHHHDQMTTRARRHSCRGEDFAERYAVDRSLELFDRYVRAFDL